MPTALSAFGRHERLELRFYDIIDEAPELASPQPADIEQLLAFGRTLRPEQPANAHVLVHCHAGVSRSSASMGLLLAQALPASSATEIFAEIRRSRPNIWPNLRILEIGDWILGRHGELITAAADLYRLQIGRRPEIVEQMRAGGRAREIVLAADGLSAFR